MYLNLDLIYNIFHYLFPLFYYKHKDKKYKVYSPFTKKGICFDCDNDCCYFDYITLKYNLQGQETSADFSFISFKVTEEFFLWQVKKFFKCTPFKLTKEKIDFLQSNIRIK